MKVKKTTQKRIIEEFTKNFENSKLSKTMSLKSRIEVFVIIVNKGIRAKIDISNTA